MDNKIFKRLLREGIEARKNGQQKSVQEVFGKVASVDTGRGRRPASVRGDHDDEGDRTIPNFKEYSTSGCSEEEWEERIIDKGEDPKTVKCRGADEDEVGADEEEEKLIWGLTSTGKEGNPDSLASLFKKYKILSNEQAKDLIQKIIDLSHEKRSDINLEEQIKGDRAEKRRVFNAKDTAELLQTIASFKLKKDVGKKLLRVLNLWGRLNTVRFESPAEKVKLWADEEPGGDDREAKLAAKEKYRMSLASLERTLKNIIDKKKLEDWKGWIKRIQDAIKEDIPDMRLAEARDPVAFSNTLAVLRLLRGAYKMRGLDFKPLERVVYDFLKVNNLRAITAREAKLDAKEKEWDKKGLNKKMREPTGADDEDFAEETPEKGSGDEEKPKDSVGDKEYCSDLLGALKKSNPELFDDLKFDQSVAGSLSNLANDISFSADAVALSAMAAGASFPPAGPAAIIVAGGAEIVARQAAGVAVVADLFSGEYKKAAIDAIGLIPWGKYAAKGLGKLGSKLAEAGSESSSKAIKNLAKTLGGASSSLAEKGAEGLTESFVAKMVEAGVDEATAKAAAKALTTALEQKIQNTYKDLADGAPTRDGKTEKEYREALKEYRTMKREAINNEYKKCMTKEGTAFQQTLINFFNESDKLVDDIPAAFDSLINAGLSFAGKGLEKIEDVYSWFEKMVGDSKRIETTRKPKAPELPPSPAVPAGMARRATTRPKKSKLPPGTLRPPERLEELKRRLNEQRYRKLLKRFNI